MERVAILNQKGGVGKTVTALQMAAWLTARGKSVLSVDLDPQANLSTTLHGEVDPPFTTYDVLVGGAGVKDAAVDTRYGSALLSARAHKRLATIDAVLGSDPDKAYLLDMALEAVEGDYDFAVIDTPGVRDTLAYNALTAADWVLIPAQGDDYSLDGIGQLAGSIRIARRRANPDLRIVGVLMTIFRGNTIIARDMARNIGAVAETLGTSVFGTRIAQSCIVPEACASGMSVFDYAPSAAVTRDYGKFMEEFMERIGDGIQQGA